MEMIHVSPIKNYNSIIKDGLLAQKPLLPQFNKFCYNKQKGLVFGIEDGSNRLSKYLKDTIYWKIWGEPRNIFLGNDDIYTWGNYCRFREIGPKLFNFIKTEETDFIIFRVVIKNEIFDTCLHAQYPEMNEFWMDMDIRYEHFDKPLVMVNDNIKPINIKGLLQ